MRLADAILTVAGTDYDARMGGAFTSIAAAIAKAERFELTDDVVSACCEVKRSKPSSLVAAMPIAQLPCPALWIEWLMPTDGSGGQRTRFGCLVEQAGRNRDSGTITWAWSGRPAWGSAIDPELTLCPLAMWFDWGAPARIPGGLRTVGHALERLPKERGEALLDIIKTGGYWPAMYELRPAPRPSAAELRADMAGSEGLWRRFAGDTAEQAAAMRIPEYYLPVPSPHCWVLWQRTESAGLTEKPAFDELEDAWLDQLQGHPVFLMAFLVLLNSRQGVQRIGEDLGRLNGRRKKGGKPELLEFTKTLLYLPRAAFERRAAAAGRSRAELRRHLCRGHFKIRKTGVFWWSPFLRGGASPLRRDHYEVRLRPDYRRGELVH